MDYQIKINEILDAQENTESPWGFFPKKYKYLLQHDLALKVFYVLRRSYIAYESSYNSTKKEYTIYTDTEPYTFERVVIRAIMEEWAKEHNMTLALAKSETYDGELVKALMDLYHVDHYAVNDNY